MGRPKKNNPPSTSVVASTTTLGARHRRYPVETRLELSEIISYCAHHIKCAYYWTRGRVCILLPDLPPCWGAWQGPMLLTLLVLWYPRVKTDSDLFSSLTPRMSRVRSWHDFSHFLFYYCTLWRKRGCFPRKTTDNETRESKEHLAKKKKGTAKVCLQGNTIS